MNGKWMGKIYLLHLLLKLLHLHYLLEGLSSFVVRFRYWNTIRNAQIKKKKVILTGKWNIWHTIEVWALAIKIQKYQSEHILIPHPWPLWAFQLQTLSCVQLLMPVINKYNSQSNNQICQMVCLPIIYIII